MSLQFMSLFADGGLKLKVESKNQISQRRYKWTAELYFQICSSLNKDERAF